MEGTGQLLDAVGNAPAVTGIELQPCINYLERLKDRLPGYANIGLNSPAGRLTCRALLVSGDAQLGARLFFRHALATGKLAIGEYIIGRTTGMRTINFGLSVVLAVVLARAGGPLDARSPSGAARYHVW